MERSVSPPPEPTSSTPQPPTTPRGPAHEVHRRARGKGDRVGPPQIAQQGGEGRLVERGIVHPLLIQRAHRQRIEPPHPVTSNRRPSAASPGPKASATPGPGPPLAQNGREREHQRGRRHIAEPRQHVASGGERVGGQPHRGLHRVQHAAPAGVDRPLQGGGIPPVGERVAHRRLRQRVPAAGRAPRPTAPWQSPCRRRATGSDRPSPAAPATDRCPAAIPTTRRPRARSRPPRHRRNAAWRAARRARPFPAGARSTARRSPPAHGRLDRPRAIVAA